MRMPDARGDETTDQGSQGTHDEAGKHIGERHPAPPQRDRAAARTAHEASSSVTGVIVAGAAERWTAVRGTRALLSSVRSPCGCSLKAASLRRHR